MLQSIKNYVKELFNTQENAEETLKEELNSKSQIIEREQLHGTPFWTIKTEQGWFLVMGEHRLSSVFQRKDQVKGWLLNNQWQVIMQIIVIVTNKMKEEKEITKKAYNGVNRVMHGEV